MTARKRIARTESGKTIERGSSDMADQQPKVSGEAATRRSIPRPVIAHFEDARCAPGARLSSGARRALAPRPPRPGTPRPARPRVT